MKLGVVLRETCTRCICLYDDYDYTNIIQFLDAPAQVLLGRNCLSYVMICHDIVE